MSGDLLSRVRGEIDARLRELRPAVLEYEQLLQAFESAELRDGNEARSAPRGARAGVRGAAAKARSAAAGPRGAGARGAAAGARGAAAGGRRGSPRGAAQLAIVAALEHGSHTLSELVVVTAMSPSSVRDGLRRLSRAGTVRKAERDGKPAYALSSPPA